MTGVSRDEALELLSPQGADLEALLARADRAREGRSGRRVSRCAILNAKSGACPMDCAFCAQSSHNPSGAAVFPLVDPDTMVEAARRGAALGARRLGIVTAGRAVEREEEIEALEEGIARIAQEGLVTPCASLGLLPRAVLERLAAAGLARYHHNIETAPSLYPSVCSTRRPEESFRTVENARRAGLEVCCGGIFGLGETPAQRVEFLETVRNLDPESVPLNFFLPVLGSRVKPCEDLTPQECLRIVAVARLMMPGKEIRVCAGREQYFGREQERMFRAGADGMMVGDYLTRKGRPSEEDRALLRRAGMETE